MRALAQQIDVVFGQHGRREAPPASTRRVQARAPAASLATNLIVALSVARVNPRALILPRLEPREGGAAATFSGRIQSGRCAMTARADG